MRVDVRGMVCPQPTAIVRRCLAALEPGDELEVVGDDPPAERSIRRSCTRHGFAVREVAAPAAEGDEETFTLTIRATEDVTLGQDGDTE